MKQEDVISFFDAHAPSWDAEMLCSKEVVDTILDRAILKNGASVLDVACGTGVLFPFYMRCKVGSVTAIDISAAMVEIARHKTEGLPIEVLCGDALTYSFGKKFDAIVIYNAFPHFPEPEKVSAILSKHLHPGGTLTIAHGMSRDEIAAHHAGDAARVSLALPPARQVAEWMEPYCAVTTIADTNTMYQVTGIYKGDRKK